MLIRLLIIQTTILFCFGAVPEKDEHKTQNNPVDRFNLENFLKKKVPVPNVPYGPGSVHKITDEKTVEKSKKEHELDELLKQIYSNFVKNSEKDKPEVLRAVTPPPTPPPTTKPVVNFKDLENAVDELIQTLSLKPNVNAKTSNEHKEINTKKVAQKADNNIEPHHENSVELDNVITNEKKDEKLTFEQFKNKFKEMFVNHNDPQIIPFKGKKKEKKNTHDNKLRNLYDDLKHEVQEEENVKVKDEQAARKQLLNEKKKELIESLNKLLGKEEFSYVGNVVKRKQADEEYERLYRKKSSPVEKIFLDKFKEGLDTSISGRKSDKAVLNDVDKQIYDVDKQIDDKERRIIETVKDFVKKHPNQQKDNKAQVVKKERLRDYLVDIIKLLKKDGGGNSNDKTIKKKAPEAKQYESELENVASKSKSISSQTEVDPNIEEILKGFDIEKRDVKLPHDRP